MKHYNTKGEICKVALFNKVKICVAFNFDTRELDTLMIGLKIRQGIAIGVFGLMLEFSYGKNRMI
tara:strand:+ start:364 stop:558 length:195 start_codon:yes stop_codon:yes gene_type:complete